MPFLRQLATMLNQTALDPQDWHDGKIPYYTLPPERGSVVKGSAEVVSSWAKEFDAEQVGCRTHPAHWSRGSTHAPPCQS